MSEAAVPKLIKQQIILGKKMKQSVITFIKYSVKVKKSKNFFFLSDNFTFTFKILGANKMQSPC